MQKTLILQSHKPSLSVEWIQKCIDSVKEWSALHKYEYMFIGDELFGYVSDELLEKTKSQLVIATDLARLKALQYYLNKGYDRVIWCDADFFIFLPKELHLTNSNYALGREVWVQPSEKKPNNFVAHVKVHNAFLMFHKENVFLEFYLESAENLLINNKGRMPPQFIGPKLLTAIHNVVQCPVLETAGMLSPWVIKDLAKGGGSALNLFEQKSKQPIKAANLCSSLYEKKEVSVDEIEKCMVNLTHRH